PPRHDLAVGPRKIKQVAKVLPPARRSQGESVAPRSFTPLLQIRSNGCRVRILAMFLQPTLDLPEKRLPHGHSAFYLSGRRLLRVFLEQICSVQTILPQKLRHCRNLCNKNNQRRKISIRLKS